jgi:hypothetical protein
MYSEINALTSENSSNKEQQNEDLFFAHLVFTSCLSFHTLKLTSCASIIYTDTLLVIHLIRDWFSQESRDNFSHDFHRKKNTYLALLVIEFPMCCV